MPAIDQPWTLVLTAGLAAVALGVLNWLAARFARRRGDEPHCRGCGYALVGIASDRCPECGRPLTPANVVRGVRPRKPVLVWTGRAVVLLGLCAAGLGVYAKSRAVDWYQYRPATWVVDDAAAADPAKAHRAWAELDRRRAAGTLAAEAEAKLVEASLAEQSKPPGSTDLPNRKRMIEHLGERYAAGCLSGPQADAFVSNLFRAELAVRPVVAVGDYFVYRIVHQGEAPAALDKWRVRYKEAELLLDGVAQEQLKSEGNNRISSGSTSTRRIELPGLTPGWHSWAVRYDIETFRPTGGAGDRSDGTLVQSRTITLSASFDVDARPPGEMVKLVDRPDLTAAVRSAVVVGRMGASQWSSQYWIELDVSAPPINVAFDVFVRGDGTERKVSTVALPKGETGRYMIDGHALKEVRSDAVDLILRSNPAVARESIDLYEIWGGEIVVPGLLIVRPAAAKD